MRQYGFSEGLFLVRSKGDGGLSYVISVVHNQSYVVEVVCTTDCTCRFLMQTYVLFLIPGSVFHVLMQRPTVAHIFTIDNQAYGMVRIEGGQGSMGTA